MARGLEDADVLEERNYRAVFRARAVRPFVNLVGVDANEDEEPKLPREDTAPPCGAEDRAAEEDEIPRTLPPREAREETGVVVVDDVGANKERADDGGMLGAVGVFEPVDDAGEEVGEGDEADDLGEREEERAHGWDGFSERTMVAEEGEGVLFDKLDAAYRDLRWGGGGEERCLVVRGACARGVAR